MFDPATEPYVSLTTFRRDGTAVATPVWIAGAEGHFYVFSEGAAGKIKRLRNDSRVTLASCDFKGKVQGPLVDGSARVTDDGDVIKQAYRALHDKYGWQMWIADFFSKLSGRYTQRAMIEVTLNESG